MSVIGQLASFVVGAKASGLPAPDRERLKLHFADTVMAALAGAHSPEGKALQSFGTQGALADRIGRRAAAIRLTEIDDIHLPSCTTPSAGTVPVALALAAEAQKFDVEEMASAVWTGTEVMARIGLAVDGPKILYRGIWPTYLAAPVAAAATAARMFGLDEVRTGHALSLAFMMLTGGVGRIHGAPSGRWFLYARSVAAGIAAAEAARAGYCGDPELLDRNSFSDTHAIALDRDRLTNNLGTASVYSTLSFKPFCAAKQTIAAVEAFRGVFLEENIDADAIAKITVRVPPALVAMISTHAEPGLRQSTMVSVAHQIALAALQPKLLYDVDRSAPTIDPEVLRFAAKVEVAPEPALEAFYPRNWPADVELEAGGKRFRRRVTAAMGDPERPLGSVDIDDKAHRVLDSLIGAARVHEWLTMSHGALSDGGECQRLATAFADIG
ncbi:MAG: MmgE/PrpD family protein [Xanthobacteraceae bacterium]